ncbi:MAG TPA: transaldolase, partial [Candidatus Nanopelagicales bacterium]|nr:transaldolase [Candidatus Nanopelagicales bacterium]
LVEGSHVVGVTTNPSIFDKAITSGASEYAAQVKDLAVRGVDLGEAVRALTTYDVRWACDVLAPVHESSGGVDGRVSIEVDPRLARNTAATVAEAKALHWAVDRPNVLIKIPATVEGLPAITAVLAEGISVNVTLIFSVDRYRAVLDAWLSGLEQAAANGHDLATIESVASFFVSRVDTEVDKRLGDGSPLRGTAAIANARVAFETFQQVLAGERWKALAAKGAHVQRPLWASTGVKDPAYSDTRYVVDLVTQHVVNTMPEATLDACRDHGEVTGDTVVPEIASAHAALAALREAGVDLDDVVRVLEEEGVEKFVTSWEQLLSAVQDALTAASKG